MDYWVSFYDKDEAIVSYMINDIPSEVVALSEALNKFFGETGKNVWITDPDKRIYIAKLEDNSKENNLVDK